MGQHWSEITRVDNIALVGVLHYRVEFAVQVNTLIRNEQPACICVELPHALRNEVIRAIRNLPAHSVLLYETADGENAVLIIEGSDGVIEGVRSGLESDTPVLFVDPIPNRFPFFKDNVPDPYLVDQIGQTRILETVFPKAGVRLETDAENDKRETYMAARLQEAARQYETVLFVGGLSHIPPLVEKLQEPQALPLMKTGVKAVVSAPLHPESLKKGFGDIPRLLEAFEEWRTAPASPLENRHELILGFMENAAAYFTSRTREEVPDYVRVTWFKFLRKWLHYRGEVLPDLYELVAAARSAMDEDFAYHVHEYLSDYKWANDPNDPSAVILNEDNLLLFGHKITLHKKLRNFFPMPRRYRMKAVNSSKWKDHLKRKWDEDNPGEVDICSYPPEDVAVEKWGETLMKHANHMLQTSRSNTEPFVADFGEGPDVRETLRRFYEQRLYVKTGSVGDIDFGAVVIIFDEDRDNQDYPFQMTWLGEHSQESDMAFYSTPPGSQVIGPGISRMEHGGFVMSYPPMRMYDVWKDSFFDFVETRPERLLMAGIVYSEKPGIVYVAKKPAAPRWKKFAKSMGKRIIYIPLGSLNPVHVRKMRTFHMLRNKGIRNSAHEYLKKD